MNIRQMKQDMFKRLQQFMPDITYTNSDTERNILQFNEY